MKKIIIALVCSVMVMSNGFALSIIDAIQTPNSKGITQCVDNTASNYGAMAPCLYIREAAPRVLTKNNNNYYSNRTNPFYGSNTISTKLVDTSAWYRSTHTHYNGSSIVDMIADQKAR